MTFSMKTGGALLFFAGFIFVSTPAYAQLLEVKQTVFGMDCAPCAYGLEKRLKNMDGVAQARVSLNEGLATIDLAKGSSAKLSTLREAIRESGFSAEESTIRATGTLKQHEGRWVFEVNPGEQYVLLKTTQGQHAAQHLKPGLVTITGRVPKAESDEQGMYHLALISIRAD